MSNKTSENRIRPLDVGLFISKNILIVLMLLIVVIMTVFVNPNYLSVSNLINILRNISVQAILACGCTVCLLGGGLDLSIGSTIGLATVVMSLTITNLTGAGVGEVPAVIIAILLSLLVGVVIGAANAFFITKFNMPPMICTIAMQYAVYGIAGSLSGGYPLYGFPDWFKVLGQGKIGIWPISVLLAFVFCIIFYILLHHTKYGMTVFAVGGSFEASRLSGINVEKYVYSIYIIYQLMAVVAAVVFSSQMKAASHSYGKEYSTIVLSAVVIGGTSIAGGHGSMLGTLKGLLFLGLILNAMTIANLNEYAQYVVRGGLIIFAIILNVVQSRLSVKVIARDTEQKLEAQAAVPEAGK